MLNAPTAGTSYGAHGVWSWENSPGVPQEHGGTGEAKPWFEAMGLPASGQLKHLSDLFRSLPWWKLRPAPGFAQRVGQADQAGANQAATHIAAARTPAGEAAVVYLPVGGTIAVQTETLPAGWRASWFNPRTGDRLPAQPAADGSFRSPDEKDWGLVFGRGV